MARLTKSIKDDICEEAINECFKARSVANRKEENLLADKVYLDVYKKKNIDLMNQMPKGALPTSDSIRVSFSTHKYTSLSFKDSKQRRIYNSKEGYRASKVYHEACPISVRLNELEKSREKLSIDRKDARLKIQGVIGKCTTLSALIKAWPDIVKIESVKPILKSLTEDRQLPSISVESLNKCLGIE